MQMVMKLVLFWALTSCVSAPQVTPNGVELVVCPSATKALQAVSGGQRAITLPGVSILPMDATGNLKCHESIHRDQSIRDGDAWIPNYVAEWLRVGYHENSYEVDARERCAGVL